MSCGLMGRTRRPERIRARAWSNWNCSERESFRRRQSRPERSRRRQICPSDSGRSLFLQNASCVLPGGGGSDAERGFLDQNRSVDARQWPEWRRMERETAGPRQRRILRRDCLPAIGNRRVQGYAMAATDGGHSGEATYASWALGHPEKVADYGYRGIHEMTRIAKALAKAYYSKGPQHSYFWAARTAAAGVNGSTTLS